MSRKTLQVEQLSRKMKMNVPLLKTTAPPGGWIRGVRQALGITLEQLGHKLSITKQSAADIEKREIAGSLTLNALKEAAEALDMHLVYGFVPKDGSLEALIDRKARAVATQIVMRTAKSMTLEDQANSPLRLKKAIDERTALLKREMPKILWD